MIPQSFSTAPGNVLQQVWIQMHYNVAARQQKFFEELPWGF